MASYRRLPSGLWQVQIFRRGVRRSESFPSKGAAQAWAGRVEAEIMAGERGDIPDLTLSALLKRYAKEISPGKKGAKWETLRLGLLGRDRIAQVRLKTLGSHHLSDWQQRRLQAVSGASVRRERNILNNAFEIARKEWRWLKSNPLEGIRRPKDGKPRERVASDGEIARLLEAASPAMTGVILFALETGMRASEIASLKEIRGRVAVLEDTKNGARREIPLSRKALGAWQDGGFGLTAGSISTLFARYAVSVEAGDLTFHCLRRTAATRLSQRLNVLELCSMFGWRDPKMVMKHYYKQDVEALARRLD